MNRSAYLSFLGKELVQDLTQVDRLANWTRNPDIVGAHAEAAVRQLVRKVISPMRCLRGSVVWEDRCLPEHHMPQLDGMLVHTGPAPTIFEIGDFALVPRNACHGVLEVKRSNYKGAAAGMRKQFRSLDGVFDALPNFGATSPSALVNRYLGVFCIETQSPSAIEKEMVENRECVYLLRKHKSDLAPCAEGAWALVEFLVNIRDTALFTTHTPIIREPAAGCD